MKYTIFINQTKVIEWWLNTSEAILVDLFSHLPKWAEKYQIINNEIWYFFSKKKILNEVPMLGDKVDTIYRICKKLEEKWLLQFQKINWKDFWKISEKIREWDFVSNLEKNLSSESIWQKFGKKSEKTRKKIRENSENFPTYNNTIYNTTINNNIEHKNISEKTKEKISEFISYRKEKKSKLTERSILAIIKKAEQYGEEKTIATIDRSIENGWQGLFWDSEQKKTSNFYQKTARNALTENKDYSNNRFALW